MVEEYDKDIEWIVKYNGTLEPVGRLVRCKDCKFRNCSQRVTKLDGKEIRCRCDYIGGYMLEDDYCSYGELKEHEDD